MTTHTNPAPVLTPDTELELVDLDDLRSAFGGASSGPADADTTPTYKTVMCPNW